MLGVISTLGSLLSLYSMTLLSVVRAYNLTQLSIPTPASTKEKVYIFAIFVSVFFLALVVACIPLMPEFEEYFINGIYYGPEIPLFTGAPSMARHQDILKVYYGRIKRQLSWDNVRQLISDMFTKDHGSVVGSDLGFYGNDGVCLFKYFVKRDDPQKGFSGAILITNSVCFVTVLVSYALVTIVARSLGQASHASSSSRNNSKLQQKITIIIGTDFICWTPFALCSLLNYLDVADATGFYGLFSIVILPINSMINPLIYDKLITKSISRVWSRSRSVMEDMSNRVFSRALEEEGQGQGEIEEEEGQGGIEMRRLGKVETLTSFVLSSTNQEEH